MGTGPFYLAKRTDTFLLYKKFKDYWGKTGYFDQVRVVWRTDATVRASMISTGEAQLTDLLEPQQVKTVPKTFIPKSIDFAWIRLRDRDQKGKTDPIWGDKRFRQALAYAIDCDAMAKALLNDTSKCTAIPFNPASVGYVDDAPRYTYDPKKARELLDQVLGVGKKMNGVKIFSETGDFPKTWAESIISYWKDVGVNATFQFVDGERREKLHQPGTDGMPPDVFVQRAHTNDLYDGSVTFTYMDGCNEPRSYSVCDEAFVERLDAAKAASGDERDQLMSAITTDVFIDQVHQIPLWDSPDIFGAVKNLEWTSPDVGWLRPDLMSLS